MTKCNKIDYGLKSYDNKELINKLEKLNKKYKQNISINYENLIEDWCDKVLEKVEKCEEIEEKEYYNNGASCRDGWLRGYYEGLVMAISIFNRLKYRAEKGLKKKS